MSGSDASAAPASAYDAIVGALASTARGRDFLAEHARRARAEDTATLLDAISRLGSRLDAVRPGYHEDRLRARLDAVHGAIRTIESRLVPDWARMESDGLAGVARGAVVAIGEALEGIQETAWLLREAGTDADLCDRLDRNAATIGLASSRSDAVALELHGLSDVIQGAAVAMDLLRNGASASPFTLPTAWADDLLPAGFADDLEFVTRAEEEEDAAAEPPASGARP